MALTAGHVYYAGPAARSILLCTAAATFGFVRLPDGDVETMAADGSAELTDLQQLAAPLAAPYPTCKFGGVDYQAVAAYSDDGTTGAGHVKAVMLRAPGASTSTQFVVARDEIPTSSILPVGSLG